MKSDKLIKLISEGDTAAFNKLYAETSRTVYYIALSIVKDRSLAEDVMQTAYMKIIDNSAKYKLGTNANAWIASITRNEALNVKKKAAKTVYVDERQTPEIFGTQQTDDYGLIIDLARRILSEEEFAILMLITANGYRLREVGEMLDIPLSTVGWKYNNALEKLRSSLED